MAHLSLHGQPEAPRPTPEEAVEEQEHLARRAAHLGLRNPGGRLGAPRVTGNRHTSCQQRISGYDLTRLHPLPTVPLLTSVSSFPSSPPYPPQPTSAPHATQHVYIIDLLPQSFVVVCVLLN
ncbi:hypothetical protein E2C01_035517 [Portunus trituberculatus]|uniref:Uncharacterized protein n=1 Tax=Portunus trituberculatus TaxID=210409 RepID=A0A5B7F9Z0_PORTR|nr:hypothetical protein [Portunus trituberculatus]